MNLLYISFIVKVVVVWYIFYAIWIIAFFICFIFNIFLNLGSIFRNIAMSAIDHLNFFITSCLKNILIVFFFLLIFWHLIIILLSDFFFRASICNLLIFFSLFFAINNSFAFRCWSRAVPGVRGLHAQFTRRWRLRFLWTTGLGVIGWFNWWLLYLLLLLVHNLFFFWFFRFFLHLLATLLNLLKLTMNRNFAMNIIYRRCSLLNHSFFSDSFLLLQFLRYFMLRIVMWMAINHWLTHASYSKIC